MNAGLAGEAKTFGSERRRAQAGGIAYVEIHDVDWRLDVAGGRPHRDACAGVLELLLIRGDLYSYLVRQISRAEHQTAYLGCGGDRACLLDTRGRFDQANHV